MEPIEAVEKALVATKRCLTATPSFGIYQSIQAHLTYLLGVLRGMESDRSRLKQINFGVYAAKEFEDSDPEFAQALHRPFGLLHNWQKALRFPYSGLTLCSARTACKLRLQVPSALCAPAAG